jgi:DNA-binding MarR family transcriptional regulator/CheY-like chemotaxis protein
MVHQQDHFIGAKRPLALIFGDSDAGRDAAAHAVTAVGGRIAAQLPLADAADRLRTQVSLDAVLVDLSGLPDGTMAEALERIDALAGRENIPTIIAMTPALIDPVAASMRSPSVTLICAPDPVDRVVALSCALVPQPDVLQDVSTEMDSVRLRRLADEVNRIARALVSLSGTTTTPYGGPTRETIRDEKIGYAAEPGSLATVAMPEPSEIRTMLRLRRLRDNFFDPILFADPAWDMLLDLLAARLEGEQVAVSSLCIAAAVPPTTALRWIKAMTDSQLFERHADPSDGRRIFIALSDMAANGMARYMAAAKRIGGMAV